jgi:hypothetical protein
VLAAKLGAGDEHVKEADEKLAALRRSRAPARR